MSILSRVKIIARAKTHATLDDLEQPRELFDYAIEEQRQLVRNVNRGLVEVATSRQRLERQAQTLRHRIPTFETQARQAIEVGREDLARAVLERKQSALEEIEAIERTAAGLENEEQQLATSARQLSNRIEQFSTRRTIVVARHDAAAAQVRAGEAIVGVSGDFADLTAAIQRAEERTDRLTSRATAINTLITSGTLDLPLSPDRIESELKAIASSRSVEEELRRLRADLAVEVQVVTQKE